MTVQRYSVGQYPGDRGIDEDDTGEYVAWSDYQSLLHQATVTGHIDHEARCSARIFGSAFVMYHANGSREYLPADIFSIDVVKLRRFRADRRTVPAPSHAEPPLLQAVESLCIRMRSEEHEAAFSKQSLSEEPDHDVFTLVLRFPRLDPQ